MPKIDDQISIPFPRISRDAHRGLGRLSDEQRTRPTTFRISDEDHAHVSKAANRLNMTFSEFVRWCAFYGAIAVNNELERRSFKDEPSKPELDTSGYT